MKVLLDECIPKALKRHLLDHEVQTVPEAGWAGKTNGELLALASGRFDIFLTVDKNLQFQQNLLRAKVAILLFLVADNSIDSMLPLVDEINATLKTIQPNEFRIIGSR